MDTFGTGKVSLLGRFVLKSHFQTVFIREVAFNRFHSTSYLQEMRMPYFVLMSVMLF